MYPKRAEIILHLNGCHPVSENTVHFDSYSLSRRPTQNPAHLPQSFLFLPITNKCLTHEKTDTLLRDWIEPVRLLQATEVERAEYDVRVDV